MSIGERAGVHIGRTDTRRHSLLIPDSRLVAKPQANLNKCRVLGRDSGGFNVALWVVKPFVLHRLRPVESLSANPTLRRHSLRCWQNDNVRRFRPKIDATVVGGLIDGSEFVDGEIEHLYRVQGVV